MSRQGKKYSNWRKRVLGRDGWKCRMCGGNKNLQTHHIKKFANHPTLRHMTKNGIVLCITCHAKIYNKEEQYEKFFIKLLEGNANLRLRLLIDKYKKKKDDSV